MPNIDLSILNQRQTPAFYADTLANRPAAGFVGRIFVSTNTFAFYRDNGTGWDLIGGPGTGTITGSGATGQIALWDGASTITGDSGLTYNGTDNSLTASKFIVTGGTSSQFLKGDGSLDSSAYLTTNIYNGNGTLSGERTVFLNNNNLIFDGGASIARVRMDADTNVARIFSFATNNLPRFAIRVDGTESGGNTGSDYAIRRYDDAGTFVDAPLTITRSTGQSTFAKKVVIENNAGDQQLQIVSTTAPSIRLDNAQTGATKRAGLGISTATNNFIQGSADGDYCVFNSSTTASPILFGIYDAGLTNTQEAARISPARNFLVGQVVDNGEKLQIGGNIYITSAGSTAGQRITLQNTTVNEIQYAFVNGGSSINNLGRLAIRNGANGTNLLQIDSAGTSYLQDINAGVSAALNTIAAVNGSGGGNRQFDLSFTGTTTGFVGQDSGDQGYGYFQVSIESGKVYQIQTTIATVNGSPITVITSSSTNFATGTVQTVEASPIDGTSYYQFTASGAAAYIGIGFARTSGTMTATVTNFSIKELNNVLITNNGNVGIQRTTAEFPLDVNGDIAFPRTSKLQFSGPVAGDRQRAYFTGNGNNDIFIYAASGGVIATFHNSTNTIIGGTTNNGSKLQVVGDISASKNILIENATNGEIQNAINANSVNGQGSFRWRSYGRGYVKTGAGTKLIIPFTNQGNLNIVTVARILVCSADLNNSFGNSMQVSFSVGSLTALSNLVILSSGGNYISAAVNGMNVEITMTGNDAIYMYLEYLTPVPSYSIDLGNISLQ